MSKNENGVYVDYQTEVVARRGSSNAEVHIASCDDGLYRCAIRMDWSHGGFSGPITDEGDCHQTYKQAKEAGIRKLLERWPKPYPSYPASVQVELGDLKRQVEGEIRQPSLF